jgi:Arc/MetJ-type ribon-helix-helix transcriptional regulator
MASDLSPDTESFIQREIALGNYQSREDAIEAGVALLKQRRALVDRLAESRRQLDEGDYFEYDEDGLRELFEQLIARTEAKSQQR